MHTAGITEEASPALSGDEVEALYSEAGWTTNADDGVALGAAPAAPSRVVAAARDGRRVGLERALSDGGTGGYLHAGHAHPDAQRAGVGRAFVLAALEPYSSVRQKVLLTDDEPGQRAFYESLAYQETRDHGAGSLRAFVRFDG